MGERLKGKNAVVTGGAGGLGKPICLGLAAEGARVVVCDVGATTDGTGTTTGPSDAVVEEIKKAGGEAIPSYESVIDFNAAERLIQTCIDIYGRIDIMVNAHGNLRDRMIWNMTEDEWESVMNVHMKGTFNTCRHACKVMREQRYGKIINVTSDAWRGATGHVNYGAVKGGVVSLTRCIAREMGRYAVTANCFAPIAATRMTLTEEVKAGMKKRLDSGLITQDYYDKFVDMPGPEHVPPLIVYLATDEAKDINGQTFHIERGRVGIYSEPVEVKQLFNDGEIWSVDELADLVPRTLLLGYTNPAPEELPKEK